MFRLLAAIFNRRDNFLPGNKGQVASGSRGEAGNFYLRTPALWRNKTKPKKKTNLNATLAVTAEDTGRPL